MDYSWIVPIVLSSAAIGAVASAVVNAIYNIILARGNRIHEIAKLKQSNAHEIQKLEDQFKQKIVGEIIENIEKFNAYQSEFWLLTQRILIYQDADIPISEEDSLKWNESYNRVFSDLSSAEAKAILINENEAAKLIYEYGNTALYSRNRLGVQGELNKTVLSGVTVEELLANRDEYFSLRRQIYRAIKFKPKGAPVFDIGSPEVNKKEIAT